MPQGPLPLILAIAVFVAEVALLASVVWFFRVALNTKVFLEMMVKLERADRRVRLTKLLQAAGGAQVALYATFLFSLDLPRKSIRGASDGFRDAAPAVDFDVLVREEAERGRLYFSRKVHGFGAMGVVGGTLAAALCVVFIQMYGQWPLHGFEAIDMDSKVAVIAGGIGIFLGISTLRSWVRLIRGLRETERFMVPFLRPREEMTEEQRDGTDQAKAKTVLQPLSG